MKKFLFVDNDTEFTTSLINIVMARHPEFEFVQCKNSHDAINLIIFGKFDYVFIDYYLGENLTGDKLIKSISGKYFKPEQIYILSGIAPDEIDGALFDIDGLYNRFILKTEFIDTFTQLFGNEKTIGG